MKTIKLFFLLCLSFSLSNCASVNPKLITKNPPFSIEASSYNFWVGGLPGISGKRVILKVNATKEVVFESIYFQGLVEKIQLKTLNNKEYLLGDFNTSTREENKPINTISKEEFPFKLNENEAMLGFIHKGKRKYFKVLNIKKTETDFYP